MTAAKLGYIFLIIVIPILFTGSGFYWGRVYQLSQQTKKVKYQPRKRNRRTLSPTETQKQNMS